MIALLIANIKAGMIDGLTLAAVIFGIYQIGKHYQVFVDLSCLVVLGVILWFILGRIRYRRLMRTMQ